MLQSQRLTLQGLNTDVDAASRTSAQYVDATNVALGLGYLTGLPGNDAVPLVDSNGDPWLPADGTNTVVGKTWDAEADVAFYLIWNDEDAHRLVRFDPAMGTVDTVLEWSGLNPPAPNSTHADGLPKSAQLLAFDGRCFYLDADGEARDIPVQRALDGEFTAPILEDEPYCLHLLCLPPPVAPGIDWAFTVPDVNQSGITAAQVVQFALRYRYVGDKVSGTSPYSELVELNRFRDYADPPTPFSVPINVIQVTLPETHPAFVREVELLVRYDASPSWNVANIFRPLDGGGWTEDYLFTGVLTGEAVPLAETTKPFETLWPGRALCAAQNRLIGWGQEEGFLLPTVDLQVAARQIGVVDRTAEIFYSDTFSRYLELISGVAGDPAATYREVTLIIDRYYPTTLPATTYGALTSLGVQDIYRAKTLAEFDFNRTFHGGVYPVAILFRDALNRHAGATAPVMVGVGQGTDYEMAWGLPSPGGDPAAVTAQIPPQAVSYQILVGQNASVVAFRQGRTVDMLGYFGDDSGGIPILRDRVWIETQWTDTLWWSGTDFLPMKSVWVDISSWPQMDNGYVFDPQSGARLRFLGGGSLSSDYRILRQIGDYLELDLRFGPTDQTNSTSGGPQSVEDGGYTTPPWEGPDAGGVVEIFIPRTTVSDTPLLYEASPIYPITRTTIDDVAHRSFSTTEGVLVGDCVARKMLWWQIDYDKTYTPPTVKTIKRDELGDSVTVAPTASTLGLWMDMSRYRGTAHLAPVLQYRSRPSTGRFSLPRIQGTAVDGVSVWDALNEKSVPRELGAVVGARLVDDVSQSTGSVLAVICRDNGGSFYIGRAQLRDAGDVALNVEAEQVLGSFNTWRGTNGCQDPDSISSGNGFIFAVDRTKQVLWRIGQDGQTALSVDLKCQAIVKALLDDSSRVHGVYDPIAREYWAVGDNGRAVLYSQRQGQFVGNVRTFAEAMVAGGTTLLSFYDGVPWRHSTFAPVASFGGLFTAPSVTTVAAEGPTVTKRWENVSIETASQTAPVISGVLTSTGQESSIPLFRMMQTAGVWRCGFMRQSNSTHYDDGRPISPGMALYEGAVLMSPRVTLTLQWPDGDPAAQVVALTVGYIVAGGQAVFGR